MVTDILTTLTTAAGYPLFGGGLLGFACGYFLRKLLRFVLIALGAIVFFLGLLQYRNWIDVHWAIVENQTSTMMAQFLHKISAVTGQMNHEIPVGGLGLGVMGFASGMAIGFLRG